LSQKEKNQPQSVAGIIWGPLKEQTIPCRREIAPKRRGEKVDHALGLTGLFLAGGNCTGGSLRPAIWVMPVSMVAGRAESGRQQSKLIDRRRRIRFMGVADGYEPKLRKADYIYKKKCLKTNKIFLFLQLSYVSLLRGKTKN
jgi:hypothetical protein